MRLLLFYRLMVRPLFREPMRTALTIFAVALGVAVVIAIELAGDAAAGSFRSSVESLAGDSEIEVTATGGVPDGIVGKLATLPYAIRVRPRIEDYAVLPDSGESVPLVGLDLIAEAGDRESGDWKLPDLADESEKGVDVSDSIWVGHRIAAEAGRKIRLQINDQTRECTVRGVLPSSAGENVTVMDIAEAQRELGRAGRVDRVLIRVPDQPSLETWQQRLRQVLPEGVQVRPQGSGTEENRRMLAAFRWNLRILSYVALVVGAFLIYNTISVSVVRRRPEIGVVRALGASRGTVLGAFLGEAAFFGVAGALLALPLGRLLAIGAVKLLSTTVNALYVSSRPGSIAITWWLVGLALLIGVGVAVLSAFSPAREAAQVSPVEAMARGQREYVARVHKWRDLWIAVALGCAGTLAAKAPAIAGKPLFGYLSAILFIGASAMAMPAIVELILLAGTRVLRSVLGVEALLASRSLVGSLRRTAVLVGALSTAIAMMTSVGIMVGSFRQTVVVWMDSQLPADLYLRPAGNPGIDKHPTISIDLTNRIERLPGVEAVDRFRSYDISYQGMPATLASAETETSRYYRTSGFVSGRPAIDVVRELEQDHTAIVSEPFANKHHVKTGDTLTLPLGERDVSFRVIDIFYDYASESGFVILDRSTMLRYLPDPAPTNLSRLSEPRRRSRDSAPPDRAGLGKSRRSHLLQSRHSQGGGAHLRSNVRDYLCAGGGGDHGGRDGNRRSLAGARHRPAPRTGTAALPRGFHGSDKKDDPRRSGSAWIVVKPCRLGAGIRALARVGLCGQQTIVRMDDPVSLAGRSSGRCSHRRLPGNGVGRLISRPHRHAPEPHRGSA